MNLNKKCADFFGWNLSVLKKLSLNTPSQAFLSVFFFGFSQLFMIIAMFLPLKVIILLSTSTIPSYLIGYMTNENKQDFVYSLVVLAFLLYLSYVFFEWLFKRFAYKGANLLLHKSKKIDFFENQKNIACELYLRYCKMLSSLGIVLVVFSFGLFINSEVFIGLIIVCFLQYALTYSLYRINGNAASWITNNLNIYLNILSSINFLIAFLLLVIQYRIDPSTSILLSLLSIILTRQAMQRTHGILLDASYLVLNDQKFNALFYSHIQYLVGGNKQHNDYMSLVSQSNRIDWISKVIAQVTGHPCPNESIVANWRDSGTANIGCFDVLVSDDSNAKFTIKLYAPNKLSACNHERLLYVEMGSKLDVLPKFIGAMSLNEYEVQVYSLISQKMVSIPKWKSTLNELFLSLWCEPPTERLVSIYSRSKPLLYQRITSEGLEPLFLAANNQVEMAMVHDLIDRINEIIEKLSQAPLFVFNPEMARTTAFVDGSKKQVNSWSRWTLEPVGAGLPVPLDDLATELASKVVKRHPESLSIEQLLFNAYVYEFEKCLTRQNFQEAMSFLPKIIKYFDMCDDQFTNLDKVNNVI